MRAYVIHGNTRSNSNTESLAKLLINEIAAKGIDVEQVLLREKNVQTCIGCYKCLEPLLTKVSRFLLHSP